MQGLVEVRPEARPSEVKRTTDSNHFLTVFPNLARTLTLSAPDQLWAVDITYVRLLGEFVWNCPRLLRAIPALAVAVQMVQVLGIQSPS